MNQDIKILFEEAIGKHNEKLYFIWVLYKVARKFLK
jgi:hypothetical protein